MPVRANLGIYTQPISFIGLPVVVVPVALPPPQRADQANAPRNGACRQRRQAPGNSHLDEEFDQPERCATELDIAVGA